MSKKLLFGLGICFVLLIAVLILGKDKFSNRNTSKVVVQESSLRTIVESVNANGKIYPYKEVKLSLELPGEVNRIYVAEGDSVKKGQLLLEIDADSYISSLAQSEANYNQSQANLANAKARLSQASTQLGILEKDYKRKKDLLAQGVISPSEFEVIESQFLSAQGENESAVQTVEANKYQVASALAAMQQTKENLTRTKLYAPMDGIVSKLNVEQGEKVVGTAQMAGTELISISDFSALELKVEVGENEVLRIHKNDTALIEVDAYLGEKVKGYVSQIAYSSNSVLETEVTKFEVFITLIPSSYAHLISKDVKLPYRPGMSASAEIITSTKKNVLCVAIESVSLRDLNEEDNFDENTQVVFVVEEGKIVQKEVKTGIQDDSYIEILEGVSAGEQVVSAPFKSISKILKDGDAVIVVSEDELYEESK